MEVRTGIGFDAHKYQEKTDGSQQFIWLGGVKIPSEKAIEAHSDGDVLIHAIVDSILGSIADGDIGSHFPPSNKKWKNSPSKIFLKFACERLLLRKAEIINIDAIIICEKPKISLYREEIVNSIAEIVSIELGRVSIKATTTEGMGFVGREEGIAVQAITTIRLENSK